MQGIIQVKMEYESVIQAMLEDEEMRERVIGICMGSTSKR
jgi:hypothetical protein